jgi:hypothetical protein
LGDTPYDTITVYPNLTQNILPDITNAFTLGTTDKRWLDLYNTLLDVDSVTQISNNTLTTLTGNTNLQLSAAGSGQILVTSSDVSFGQNLTVGGTLTVNSTSSLQSAGIVGNIGLTGNINQTGNTYITGTLVNNNNIQIIGPSYLQGHYVKFYGNEVSITQPDTDLTFAANGTGGVVLDQKLKITNNEISNSWTGASGDLQKSIQLTPNGTGNVVIDSISPLVFPLSSDSNRVLSNIGEVRYDTAYNAFEGYSPSGKVSFNGIWDSARHTYITAELTPGAADNTIRFGINNTVKATLDATKLFSNINTIGNLTINNNTIANTSNSTDVNIFASGSGVVDINNIQFSDNNNITNTTESAIILQSTGTGYIKFGGKGAIVVPYGPTEDRRLNPEVGEIRNNSTLGYMEVFDGTSWNPAIGTSGAATLEDVELAMDIWSLVLG